MGICVGIDLGTTFCVVTMIDERTGKPVVITNVEGGLTTPSVIQFFPDGSYVVGMEAKDAYDAGDSGCVGAFKREMGKSKVFCEFYGKKYTAIDLSGILLKYLKESAQKVSGKKIDEAVITVPAYFYNKEREATVQAAKLAGLKVRQIINEPTAAAMNYGIGHWRENAKILVYDLGGGTFDITLVSMEANHQLISLQTLGDHTLGGKDWDSRLLEEISERIYSDTGVDPSENQEMMVQLSGLVEGVKKQLSLRQSYEFAMNVSGYGRYTTVITQQEFEDLTIDLIEKTGSLCQHLLDQLSLRWSDITDVLLVGGSTRMPQVSKYLMKLSHKKPLNQVDPDLSVGLGAAMQTLMEIPEYHVIMSKPKKKEVSKNRQVKNEVQIDALKMLKMQDVQAHALGIIAVDPKGEYYINQNIIPPNQEIPVKAAKQFNYYTSSTEENEVEVYLLQGTKPILECEILDKYVIYGIQHVSKQPTKIRIQYSYDINGMVNVQARQDNGEVDLPIRREPIPDDMSMYGRPVERKSIAKMMEMNIILAIDTSYSMKGQPTTDAQRAMEGFIKQFEDSPTKIAVMPFANRASYIQNLTHDLRKCKKSLREIEKYVEEGTNGYGNGGEPFTLSKSTLTHSNEKNILIVLTDGMWDHPEEAIKLAKECHRNNIEVIAIGFGSSKKQFLEAISSTDASALKVEQSQLFESFGKIAQAINENNSVSRHGKKANEEIDTVTMTWKANGER